MKKLTVLFCVLAFTAACSGSKKQDVQPVAPMQPAVKAELPLPTPQPQMQPQPGVDPVLAATERAALNNDAAAQYQLGVIYENGTLVQQDLDKAFEWYRKSAAQSYAPAQGKLAFAYFQRQPNTGIKDTETAVKYMRAAASAGDVNAMYLLGILYTEGRAVPKNEQAALGYFGRAADKGHALSQYNIGVMYKEGNNGLRKDGQMAIYWFTKAAKQNDKRAMYALGTIYRDGCCGNVPANAAKAREWFAKGVGCGCGHSAKALEAMK